MSEWRGKVVLITGGSSGLGYALAEAWADAGALVAIVARDSARLDAAVQRLNSDSPASTTRGRVLGMACDVTNQSDVERLMARVTSELGRLDVLVNNVGQSTRGQVLATTPETFQQLWETNFLSVVRCTRAAATLLTESRGIVVNIGSLASKSANKYLGGYPATKFAVAAYSQQLRLEWAQQGVHVLLVCPGPIARDDAGRRYAEQAADLPEEARRPGGGVRLKGIPPERLAARILDACRRRVPELVVPWKARALFAIQQLFPSLGDWLLSRSTKQG